MLQKFMKMNLNVTKKIQILIKLTIFSLLQNKISQHKEAIKISSKILRSKITGRRKVC
jgi:hypothetical protein